MEVPLVWVCPEYAGQWFSNLRVQSCLGVEGAVGMKTPCPSFFLSWNLGLYGTEATRRLGIGGSLWDMAAPETQTFFFDPYQPPCPIPPQVLGQGVFLLAFAPALSLLHQSHARASRAPSHLFSIILFPPEKQPKQSKHEDLRWPQSGTPNLRCILPSQKSLTIPPTPRLCSHN